MEYQSGLYEVKSAEELIVLHVVTVSDRGRYGDDISYLSEVEGGAGLYYRRDESGWEYAYLDEAGQCSGSWQPTTIKLAEKKADQKRAA